MYIYNLAALFPGFPFGHHLHHTHGLFITAVADSLLYLDIAYRTVAPYDKRNEYLALGLAFLGALRIFEVFQYELSEPRPTAWKFGDNINRVVNFVLN